MSYSILTDDQYDLKRVINISNFRFIRYLARFKNSILGGQKTNDSIQKVCYLIHRFPFHGGPNISQNHCYSREWSSQMILNLQKICNSCVIETRCIRG